MANLTSIVRITGRVQGVSFRVWTRQEAEALGLAGWVRNESDGSVAALLHGPSQAVEDMLERFRRGPAGAQVNSVEAHPSQELPQPGFRIAR
jgi:acylphosphatase